jgi:hypothetical protein
MAADFTDSKLAVGEMYPQTALSHHGAVWSP